MRASRGVTRRGLRAVRLMEPLEERQLLSVSTVVGGAAGAGVPVAAVTSTAGTVTTIPLTITATVGAPFAGDVGEISGLSPGLLPRLKAFINWGDGPVAVSATTMLSQGVVYFDNAGLLHVRGTHTYETTGQFAVTVSVIQSPPAGSLSLTALYTIHSTAVVTGNSAGGVTINETAKVPFTAIVGKFNVPPSPLANPVQVVLKAVINWGDGTSSMGTILATPTTGPGVPAYNYVVDGTHTYATAGTYAITVTVYEQYPLLPGPTPLPLPVSPVSPLWILWIAKIDSTAIVTTATAPGTVVTAT